ncbi:MinD/ParA family protein [Litorimonas sp. RW-G-Af-16]|uniref:MinD/ParA family ATP-binding protein n=1 Tax=Litorimonas sp. RW-G-Af-16 TaxID=3241168 RepID=UPI00390CA535
MAQRQNILQQDHQPAGRMVSMFCPSGDVETSYQLALRLGRKAASFGETVLMLDGCDGRMMKAAGIVYNRTLADVVYADAPLRDAMYITSNEHFTATSTGALTLDDALGSLAALSLSYDWVFVLPPEGCTPAHIRLAGASDASVMTYDTQGDHFMRAYWMLDAIRRRAPKFDPLVVSTGNVADAAETSSMLSETIRDHLGAPPPYAGHEKDLHIEPRLLDQMREVIARTAVA